jgi:NAD+ kinase
VNLEKDAARAAVGGLCRWLDEKGIEVMLLKEHARAVGRRGGVAEPSFFRKPQMIVSLGGDGTFLHVARHIRGIRPALLGVNFGRLGFLTAVEASEVIPFFEALLKQELPIEHRLRVACEIRGWDDPPWALNDIVVQDGEGVRALRLRIHSGDQLLGDFRADGVILATPTGSTAYGLSVGGPVVHPGVDALLIALVSPHTLSARPVVVSPRDEVRIAVDGDRPVRVTIDGQTSRQIPGGVAVRVRRAEADVAVVVDPDRSFIDRLREKLSWGRSSTL